MLANFLDKSKPINFIGLLIFFFICFTIKIYFTFFSTGFEANQLTNAFIYLLIFLFIFFFHNFILAKNKLTFDNSYGYYFFSLFVICLLPELFNFKSLLCLLSYTLFLRKIYSLKSNKNILQKLFDMGFWLGVLFIMEPISILFITLVYLSIFLFKKITLHTVFGPFFGFIAPLIIYYCYELWQNNTVELSKLYQINLKFDLILFNDSKYSVFLIFIAIIAFICMLLKSVKAFSINNNFRKKWILILCNFLVAIFVLILHTDIKENHLIYLLFPVSIILANGVEIIPKKVIKNVFLYSILAGCIFFSFFL